MKGFLFEIFQFFLIKITFQNIILPLESYIYNQGQDPIENLINTYLNTDIFFGSPKKSLQFSLRLDHLSIDILSNQWQQSMSAKKLSNFSSIIWEDWHTEGGETFLDEFYFDCFESKESGKISNKPIELEFIYKNQTIDKTNSLGLDLDTIKTGKDFLLKKLYKNKLINGYFFSIILENNNLRDIKPYEKFQKLKGKFIIGDHLYNLSKRKIYKEENLCFSQTNFQGTLVSGWAIGIEKIYIGNKLFHTENDGLSYTGYMLSNYNVIFGIKFYYEYIMENFFNEYFKNNICFNRNITIDNTKYLYIYCNKNDFKYEDFPELIFQIGTYRGGLNLTLNYEDLFFYKDNYIYFIIVFRLNEFSKVDDYRWSFNIPLLRKYQNEFYYDGKMYGFYKKLEEDSEQEEDSDSYDSFDDESKMESDNENKINQDKEKDNNSKYIIIIVLLILFLLISGMYIFRVKILNKNKKIRANELEDNFLYEPYREKK